jgi:hypothetical protein
MKHTGIAASKKLIRQPTPGENGISLSEVRTSLSTQPPKPFDPMSALGQHQSIELPAKYTMMNRDMLS